MPVRHRQDKGRTGQTKSLSTPAQAKDRYVSKAVRNALEALDFIRESAEGVTMNSLATRLALSRTSAFRLLRTLEATGHVAQDARGTFRIAPARLSVAAGSWIDELVSVAMPHLRALSDELAETASLAAHFENRVEVVAVLESAHDVRMSNVVGHIVPPNASSLGKSVTAFQSPEAQERLLRSFKVYRFTEHTITDRKLLLREYEVVRSQGYAVDREECTLGGICFSVPVLSPSGNARAAISVSMPKTRLHGPAQEQDILRVLRATAHELARDLQFA